MNTPKNNVIVGSKATKELLEGIKIGTSAIRLTYGAKGVNAIIELEDYPYHIMANDCETILQAIQIEPGYKKVGLDVLKELSSKANKDSGDGRKTTCIIGEEIIEKGFGSEELGIELKRELDNFIPLIEQKIDEQKRSIGIDDVESVATIAGGSREIGKTLGEIYKRIGKDGIIQPQASGTTHTTTSFIDGIRFTGTGYLSESLVYDEQATNEGRRPTKAIYKNPRILVTKRRINSLDDINPLLMTLTQYGHKDDPLVIFTDDMDSQTAAELINAHVEKVRKILIVKAPILWKNYIFEDFAKVVGATIVEDSTGVTFKNLQPFVHLGTCDRIEVGDEDEGIIINGWSDIGDHVKRLTEKGDNDSLLRLSWLKAKTCVLGIGANNESELGHKRLKYYDAINSTRLALKDGIVAGGGTSLYTISKTMPHTRAGNILRTALEAPLMQILENSVSDKERPNTSLFTGSIGYDANKKMVCDMFDAGIVDATAVVKNAVRNSIALASTILTGRVVIKLPERTPEQIAAEVMRNKGMRPF